jgi:hypothetical protein
MSAHPGAQQQQNMPAVARHGCRKVAPDAVEILGLSLVLPAAEDDLKLTAAGKSALSSCIFIGEVFCSSGAQGRWRQYYGLNG